MDHLEDCMNEFSRLRLWGMAALSLGLNTACQNETPAFREEDLAAIAVSVSEGEYENEDRDNVFTFEDETTNETGTDALDIDDELDPAPRGKGRAEVYAGHEGGEDEPDAYGNGQSRRNSADQDPESDSSSTESMPSHSSSPAYSISNDDSKSIARACSRHFKGIASKIVVLSAGDSVQSLSLSAQTVLAVRLVGNQQRVKLSLAAGQPLAGLCLVLRGHEPSLQLTSEAGVKKMVYLAAGDESKGEIELSSHLDASYIELSGHASQLNLRGVDEGVCENARLRNHSVKIRCDP
jgi:hypothetical protein